VETPALALIEKRRKIEMWKEINGRKSQHERQVPKSPDHAFL